MTNTITFKGIDYDLGRIHSTKNYKIFKDVLGNRIPQLNKPLLHAIDRLTQLSPILVNEDFQVLDGQHRLLACQYLGTEVEFIIRKTGDDSELVTRLMNSSQKNWNTFDYINNYAELGDKDYNVLRSELETRSNDKKRGYICSSVVSKFLSGLWELSHNTFPKIRDGGFNVYSMSSYNDFIKFYQSLLNDTEEVNLNFKRNFQVALYALWAYKDFSTEHFLKACENDDYKVLISLVEHSSEDKHFIFKQLLEMYNENISDESDLKLLHPDVSGVRVSPHFKSLDESKVSKRQDNNRKNQ